MGILDYYFYLDSVFGLLFLSFWITISISIKFETISINAFVFCSTKYRLFFHQVET